MSPAPRPMSGAGRDGDPLLPLKHRPQIALARSIIDVLEAYHVVIPLAGRIDPQQCLDLPLAVLQALAQARLIGRA